MNQDIFKKLAAPFPFEEVEVKIQVTSKEKPVGKAVFYINSRAIQNRLDEAVGAFNWSNQFTTWHDRAQICGISIFNEVRGEWITKHDGAENSDIEAVKGGLTDAFKRAAVLWGIGRYLYQIDGVWVDIEKRGNSSFIKDNQMGRLKAAYEAAVKKIFDNAANQPAANAPPVQQKPAQPQAGSVSAKPNPAPQQSAGNAGQAAASSNAPGNVVPIYDYKVQSVNASGKSSQRLELCNRQGKLITAYIRNGVDGIEVGSQLKNVRFEEKSSSYGNYILIAGYEVAA